MVQLTQGKYLALHETKLVIDVGVTRLRDKLGMTFGVDERFVEPGVQGGVIDVVDLLTWCHVMVELDGIGASSAKGVTRVDGSTNCRESTYAWTSERVCLRWVHSHSHISLTFYPLV